MDRKEAIERIQEVMEIIRTQHMCKDIDGECTEEDRKAYIQRFEALRMAIAALHEPEIVRCKDCKYWIDDYPYSDKVKKCELAGYMVGEKGYCVYGQKVGEKE